MLLYSHKDRWKTKTTLSHVARLINETVLCSGLILVNSQIKGIRERVLDFCFKKIFLKQQ